MHKKISVNLFLVILLYSGILITGLLGVLTRMEVLAGLSVIFGTLIFNLIKTQREHTER